MNTATFPKIAEALRAVAALLDEAAEGAARAAALQPELPQALPVPAADRSVGVPPSGAPAAEGTMPSLRAPAESAAEGTTPSLPAPAESAAEGTMPSPPAAPTFEDAKGVVLHFARTLGAEETKRLLAGFGAQRLSEVPQAQWQAVIAAARARLAQEGGAA